MEQKHIEGCCEEQNEVRVSGQCADKSNMAGKISEHKKRFPVGFVVFILLIAAILAVDFWYFSDRIMKPAETKISDAYQEAMGAAFDKSREEAYNIGYQTAEQKFHVSNEIVISLGNIREIQRLEVLRVCDVSYEVPTEEEKNWLEKFMDHFEENTECWLEVPGNGVFTVNLKASEFIIDNEQKHVIVRLPNPELTDFSIDYEHVKLLNFEDDGIFKDSVDVGIDLAMEELKDAELGMRLGIVNNQKFFQQARKSAESTVTNLIKQLNPGSQNLIVDVEFYD